jgi:hypothetical protein
MMTATWVFILFSLGGGHSTRSRYVFLSVAFAMVLLMAFQLVRSWLHESKAKSTDGTQP